MVVVVLCFCFLLLTFLTWVCFLALVKTVHVCDHVDRLLFCLLCLCQAQIQKGKIKLTDTRYVVLDEADTLYLEANGFQEDLKHLLQPIQQRLLKREEMGLQRLDTKAKNLLQEDKQTSALFKAAGLAPSMAMHTQFILVSASINRAVTQGE